MLDLVERINMTKPKRDFLDHFYISLRHRYAFHTVGKAANSTVKYLLYRQEIAGTHFKLPSVHNRAESPLLSAYQLSSSDLERVLTSDDFFRFTFVRNPYSRLLSCYLDRIRPGNTKPYRELVSAIEKGPDYSPTFSEFIETICSQSIKKQNNHWRVQFYDAMCNVLNYHYIGKQESFSEDFNNVHQKIFGYLPPPDTLNVNASPSKTAASSRIEEFWTPNLKRLVAEKYQEDFDFFGYECA